MSEFEKWFEDQDFYANMRFIHGDKLFDKDGDVYRVLPVHIAFESWFASACTSIDHIHRLQRERDQLKTQLNNIEACYIEKKKQVEDQQKRIDKALSIIGNYCDEDDAALLIYVLEKALRGDSDQHLPR